MLSAIMKFWWVGRLTGTHSMGTLKPRTTEHIWWKKFNIKQNKNDHLMVLVGMHECVVLTSMKWVM